MGLKQIVNITRRRIDGRGVVDALAKGLRRRTSFGKGNRSLVAMNAPPLAAKLDAACEIIFRILSSDVSNLRRDDRLRVYEKAVQLLDEAIRTHSELSRELGESQSIKRTQSLAVLLDLLSNMMSAILAVLKSQITILDNQSNPAFSGLSMPSAESTDVNSKLKVIEDGMRASVNAMLETASEIMTAEKNKRDFGKEDQERYEKALLEFRRKLG